MKLTKQGVRDLNDIPSRSRGYRPDPTTVAAVLGARPMCTHVRLRPALDDLGFQLDWSVCVDCGWSTRDWGRR